MVRCWDGSQSACGSGMVDALSAFESPDGNSAQVATFEVGEEMPAQGDQSANTMFFVLPGHTLNPKP